MSGPSFIVPPLSWDDIGIRANRIRSLFKLDDAPYLPIMDILEQVLGRYLEGFEFLIGDRTEMDGAEGYTCPSGTFIMLDNDVYIEGCKGNGRARFTAAHELGHLVLHTNIKLARITEHTDVKAYRLTEPQANQFAAEILMPRRHIKRSDTESEIMDRFGVSYEAADNRLRYIRKKQK
ncbi:hypothetical protein IP70_10365 [alpha proteobacterium AAP38]|nr:hypothetical protein IP70_10365 [alpha proteobacterium AAP38]